MANQYIDATKVYDNLSSKANSMEDLIINFELDIYQRIINFDDCFINIVYLGNFNIINVMSVGNINPEQPASLEDILNSPKTENQRAAKEKIESIYKQFYDRLPYKE
jgi:hypothetical protein